MCTYLALTTPVSGSAMGADGDWFVVTDAVISFDHPQDAPVEHALCIDFRQRDAGPETHTTIELDADSARRLAASILAALDDPEVRALA
jgi:hypothetical protein